MDALEAIFTRRSIRKFQRKAVPDEMVRTMLAAAMSAPTADNAQPWQFIVITDRRRLEAIPTIHAYARMAADAALAIVVCGDRSLEIAPDYWLLDCSAAVQNVLLAAHALGLGAVWCGVYPGEDRIERFRQYLGLPGHVIPHSLIAIGHPAEQPGPVDRYREDRVHRERWRGMRVEG
jgi:nitroreductase